MAARKPFYGPRRASYQVNLDGRVNTMCGSREIAYNEVEYFAAQGRVASVTRLEECPAPNCKGGWVAVKGRGSMYRTDKCAQCDGAAWIDAGIDCVTTADEIKDLEKQVAAAHKYEINLVDSLRDGSPERSIDAARRAADRTNALRSSLRIARLSMEAK